MEYKDLILVEHCEYIITMVYRVRYWKENTSVYLLSALCVNRVNCRNDSKGGGNRVNCSKESKGSTYRQHCVNRVNHGKENKGSTYRQHGVSMG